MRKKIKNHKQPTTLKEVWSGHREQIAWLLAGLCALLLFISWWSPVMRAFDDLTGAKLASATTSRTPTSVASVTPAVQQPASTSTGSGTSTSTKSATTNTTTGNSTTTPAAVSPAPTSPTGTSVTATGTTTGTTTTASAQAAGRLLSARVDAGQTLDTVIGLAGRQPTSCVTAVIPLVGTQQVCAFLINGIGVSVTLLNGHVIAKTNVGL